MNSSQNIATEEQIPFSEMSLSELEMACFREGVPPSPLETDVEERCSIVVYMDEEKTEMPFGVIETLPFLEIFWRKTGADCDGEEEEMDFPDGKTHIITLRETRGE